jgi:hypothetical protein
VSSLVGHVPTFACGHVEEKELGPLMLHGLGQEGQGAEWWMGSGAREQVENGAVRHARE